MHAERADMSIKFFTSWNKTKDHKVSAPKNVCSAEKLSKQSMGRGVYLSIDSLFIKHNVVRQTTSHDKIVYIALSMKAHIVNNHSDYNTLQRKAK